MTWVAAGVTVASAAYKVYDSAHKSSQAKKLAASNKRPVYLPDGSIQEVKNLALANLNDTDLQDYGQRTIEQRQSEGIDAVLKSGGRLDFSTVNSAYGNDIQSLLSQLKMKKDANIAAFNNAAYNAQQQKDAMFQYNQDAPYKDTKQAENVLRQQSAQSAADAVSSLATAAGNYGTMTSVPGQHGRQSLGGGTRMPAIASSGFADPAPMQGATVGSLGGPSAGALAAAGRNPITGAVNTNFDYSDTRTIIALDENGNPVYN